MAKKKACKSCKLIVDGAVNECPGCKSSDFTSIFQGRVSILHPDKSKIAQRMDIHDKGDYAIKVRG